MLHELQASDFSPLLHQHLALRFHEDPALNAELLEVRERDHATPLERKPFSIVLRAEQKTHYYQQAIAVLTHPEKGDLPLFFVPIGFDGVGVLYEAVFG